MEFFNKTKVVRLKSHLDKYLIAEDNEETVRQSRIDGASRKTHWTVELVQGNSHVVRLRSCYGKYLTASDESFLLGMTGKKVLQTIPMGGNDSVIEWEPRKDGFQVKLRAKWGGKYLRANGGTPPWRNSVTHDVTPHRTATHDWILWDVEEVADNSDDDDDDDHFRSDFLSLRSTPSWSSEWSDTDNNPQPINSETFGSSDETQVRITNSFYILFL